MIPLVGGAEGGGVLPPVRAEIAVDGGVAFGPLVPLDQEAGVPEVMAAPPVFGAFPLPEVALAAESVGLLLRWVACDAVGSGDGGEWETTTPLPDDPELPERGKPRCEDGDAAPELGAVAACPVGAALPLRMAEPLQVEGGDAELPAHRASDGGDWQEVGRVPVFEERRLAGRGDGPARPIVADVAVAEAVSPLSGQAAAGRVEAVTLGRPSEGSGAGPVAMALAPLSGGVAAEAVPMPAEVGAEQASVSFGAVDPLQGEAMVMGGIARAPTESGVSVPKQHVGFVGSAAGGRDVPVPDAQGGATLIPDADSLALGMRVAHTMLHEHLPVAAPVPVPLDGGFLAQFERNTDVSERSGTGEPNGGEDFGDGPPWHERNQGLAEKAANPASAVAGVSQAAGGADRGAADAAGSVLPSGDVPSERRLPIIASPPHAHPLAAERFAALPPAVSAALVAQVRAGEAGPVTVTLSPEELGTLRFEMHGRGEAIHVALVVERPETLDLLRRHAEQLAGEFRQAGFAGASFSFSGGQAGAGGGAERWGASVRLWQGGEEEAVTLPKARRAVTGAGLNLLL